MSDNRFLVTGARGFIGAWIVKRLLASGAEVIALDQNDSQHRWQLIMDEAEIGQIKSVSGDITEEGFLHRLVEEHEVGRIIHLAGLQVPTCRVNPRLGAMVNVIGTINVFEAARLSGGRVKRVAYASSAAVFGSAEDGVAVTPLARRTSRMESSGEIVTVPSQPTREARRRRCLRSSSPRRHRRADRAR